MHFFVIVLTWLYLLTTPSEAGFVGAVVGALGFGAAATAAISGFIVNTMISMALSAVARMVAGKQREQGGGITRDQTMTGAEVSQSAILGIYGTAGSWVAPRMTHGNENKYLTYVVALSDLPGCELNAIYIDNVQHYIIPSSSEYGNAIVDTLEEIIPAPVTPVPGDPNFQFHFADRQYRTNAMMGEGNKRLKNRAWIKYYNGSQTVADPMLMSKYGTVAQRPWMASMVGRGLCYAIVTFEFDRDVFSDMPEVLFEVKGIPLYDPRKDSSVGGSGPQRWATPSTWTATTNPVIMIYNILRGIKLPDGRIWGGECEHEDLPLAVWSVEANKCDEVVEINTNKFSLRYRAGFEMQFHSEEPYDVIDELKRACSADLFENGGVYKIRVGGPGLPVAFLTDDDLLRDEKQEFTPYPGLSRTYNAIAATYPDPNNKWKTNDAPLHTKAEYVTEDEGRTLQTSVTLAAAPWLEQVQMLQNSWLLDNRKWRSHTIHVGHVFAQVETLDAVSWTSARNGYETKLFDVQQNVEQPRSLMQMFELREVDPTDYDFKADALLPYTVANAFPVTLPGAGLASFTVGTYIGKSSDNTEWIPGFQFNWVPSVEASARRIIVEVRHGVTGQKLPAVVIEDLAAGTHIFTEGVIPNQPYIIRARPVMDRPTVWTIDHSLMSPNVLLPPTALAPTVWDQIENVAAEAGVPSYTSFPATGKKPNQVILKMPEAQLYRWDATAGAWTTTLYSGVAPNSIDITKIASSLQVPMTWTGAVPTTRQASDILWRPSDNKLYRWNGSAYIATVPSTDISGTIAAAQIAALEASKITGQLTDSQIAAISAAKMTGQITGTQITDNAISAPKIAAGAIIAGKIAADAVTAATIAADAVTAGKIAAGAVIAGKVAAGAIQAGNVAAGAIQAGNIAALAVQAGNLAADSVTAGTIAALAIGAREIAADAITASKIVVADFTNIVKDPSFLELTANYLTSNITSPVRTAVTGTNWTSDYVLQITTSNANASAMRGVPIPVTAGDSFRFKCSIQMLSGSGNGSLQFGWVNAAGVATTVNLQTQALVTNGVVTFTGSGIMPAGAVAASIRIAMTAGVTSSRVGDFGMYRMSNAELIVSGAITADALSTGAVTADAIAANAIIASKIASNAVTAIKIAANAVNADKIDVTSFTAAGLALFGGALQSTNFVTGSAGWRIQNSGVAEFSDVTIRGMLSASKVDTANPLLFDCGGTRTAPFTVFKAGSETGPSSGAIVTLDVGTFYGPTSNAAGANASRLARTGSTIIVEVNVSHSNTSTGSGIIYVSVNGGAYTTIGTLLPASFGNNTAFEYTTPASFNTLAFRFQSAAAMRVTSVSMKLTASNG